MADFHSFGFCKKKLQPCSKLVSQRASLLDSRVKFYRCSQSNFNHQRMNHFNLSLYFPFWEDLWCKAPLNSKYRSKTSEECWQTVKCFQRKVGMENFDKSLIEIFLTHTSIIESHGWGMGQFSFQYISVTRDQFCAQTNRAESSIGNVSSIPVEKSQFPKTAF